MLKKKQTATAKATATSLLEMPIGRTKLEFSERISIERPEENRWVVFFPTNNYYRWSYTSHRAPNAAIRAAAKYARKVGR